MSAHTYASMGTLLKWTMPVCRIRKKSSAHQSLAKDLLPILLAEGRLILSRFWKRKPRVFWKVANGNLFIHFGWHQPAFEAGWGLGLCWEAWSCLYWGVHRKKFHFLPCLPVADSAWSLGHSRKRVRLMCSFWQMSSMSSKLATVQTRLTTVSLPWVCWVLNRPRLLLWKLQMWRRPSWGSWI